MNRMQSVIEKTIHDLDKLVIVLSHMSAEELDLDVMRAIAQGGFEMAGTIVHHLDYVLPSFSGADEAATGGPLTADEKAIHALDTLLSATHQNLTDVESALCLALYDERALSQHERDAVAKGALEMLRRVLQEDLEPHERKVAEASAASSPI